MNSTDWDHVIMNRIFSEISHERWQQISMGYTPEHDDAEYGGQLAIAAACYATPPDERVAIVKSFWPWEEFSWKPSKTDRRKELIKAAALIVAEIERLDRAAAKSS